MLHRHRHQLATAALALTLALALAAGCAGRQKDAEAPTQEAPPSEVYERAEEEEEAAPAAREPAAAGAEEKEADKKAEERAAPKTQPDEDGLSAEAADGAYFAEGPEGSTHSLSGLASWMGADVQGKTTASGERFDMYKMTAAHPSLPFGSVVRVSDPESLRSVDVRVNDRGPFKKGYIITLSYAAARELGVDRAGELAVTLEVISWGGQRGAK